MNFAAHAPVNGVLAGLVDDSNVPLACGCTVWENLIDLSGLQIFHPTVSTHNANDRDDG